MVGSAPGAVAVRSLSSLRVLFASTHSYLPQRTGGVETNTHELCLELDRRGCQVAVLARLESGGGLALANRIRRKLPFGPTFPADRRMGYPVYRGWTPAEGAAELTRGFSPSVVVTQGSRPVPLTQAFLALEVPTVLYLHDVEFHRLGGEIPKHSGLLLLANSDFTADRSRAELGVEAHVLPPLIRPEAYRVETSREVLLYVNPHPVKGVDIALRLAESRPDIPFLFLESWKLRDQLKRELTARAAGLPNLEWSDPVDDMRPIYGRTRLLLVPSQWEEAWGRLVTEAQVSGIPVLASDRGGLPESVGHGGVLVDPEAPPDTWLEALSRMWDDPDAYERLSQAALEHSRRPEIQPEFLVSRFLDLAAGHLGRQAGR